MKITILTLTTAILFGTYDLFIKLSSNKIDPITGSLIVQTTSALSVAAILMFNQFLTPSLTNTIASSDIKLSIIAGVLISLALVCLFIILKNPTTKTATTLPTILITRNLTLIILSLILLKERLSPTQALGLILSLTGLWFINY